MEPASVVHSATKKCVKSNAKIRFYCEKSWPNAKIAM